LLLVILGWFGGLQQSLGRGGEQRLPARLALVFALQLPQTLLLALAHHVLLPRLTHGV
jgi:hypothetical protein